MNHSLKKAILVGFIFFSVILLSWYLNIEQYFTLNAFKNNKDYLQSMVGNHYFSSVLLYIVVYIIIIVCALPVTLPLTLVGGFLFGFVPGIFYVVVSVCFGSVFSFLLVRYVLINTVRVRFAKNIDRFNKKIASYGVPHYLLLLQLLFVFPFFIINALAALADISLWTVVWTTIVGSLPFLCLLTFAGRQLGTLHSVHDLFSSSMITVFVILIALVLISIFVRSIYKKD